MSLRALNVRRLFFVCVGQWERIGYTAVSEINVLKRNNPQRNIMNTARLEITPMGGVGQFGMNMTVFRYDGQMMIVDAGMMFPDEDLLGVDIAIPDLSFIEEHKDELVGLVLTHAHEDHVGAIPFLLQVVNLPIYATEFTLGLIESKLQEFGLLDKVTTHTIPPRKPFQLGPFEIDFIRVSHSLVDCVALAITTPVGVVIHTGDFKVDETPVMGDAIDLKTLNEYGDKGVLALLSDSTNVEREGRTGSEKSVIPAFEQIFAETKGRMVVSCFATSIHRLQIVFDLAAEHGRAVALLGRSMLKNVDVANKYGYLDIDPGQMVTPQQARKMSPDEVVLLVTGSQGEPMAALARISVDQHRDVTLTDGDTVVLSARQIPGNEKKRFRG